MPSVALVFIIVFAAWCVWSYVDDGLMRALLAPGEGTSTLDALREYVGRWGAFAPAGYVAAVTVEVLVAPIPGVLLYAPGGAIFGGFVGGSLSLAGNVLGAAVACWLAATFGERLASRAGPADRLADLRSRLQRRGAWLVFLLRLNPLTSVDVVSYAAGLAGLRPRQVALGTLFGMMPACYAQAYLAESLFDILPPGPWPLIVLTALVVAAGALVWRRRPGSG